jgi:nucleoside-diphosphate-sugar epimerase
MSRQSAARHVLLAELADVAARLTGDELRVLLILATRVWAGQARYKCLELGRDRRDFPREALEGLADAVFHLGADVVHHRQQRRDRRPRP